MAKRRKVTDEELGATAYHEAGHAVITVALGFSINKVSIIPGEDYTGVCKQPGVLGYSFSNGREYRSNARDLIVSA